MYAKDPAIVHKEKIAKLMEMGFTEEQAKAALEKAGWSEEDAVNALMGN